MGLKTRIWTVLAVLLGLALVVGVIAYNVSGDSGSPAAADSDTSVSEEERSALAELLTVSTISDDVKCVTLAETAGIETVAVDDGKVYQWNIGALEPVGDNGRQWSDAVSTPFGASNPNAMRTELFVGHCVDPLLAGQSLHWFANAEIEGHKLVDLNPWLKPWVGDNPEEIINARAAEFAPLLDIEDPTSEQTSQAVAKQLEWQEVAAKLNTLLTRFELVGVQDGRASVLNYHLVAGGLVVGDLPAVGYNDVQEDLPTLVFSLTRKDACAYLDIGYNTGDKRLEWFEPSCQPTPGTTVPSKPTIPTTVPATPTTTTVPPTTPTTTVPPTTPTTTVPGCPPPLVPGDNGDCRHPHIPEECQQNGVNCPDGVDNDVIQDPQDNTTAENNGVNTGPTPGAPAQSVTPPRGPAPQEGTPAPEPNETGYDSGAEDGSGTPGGSTCHNNTCTGGGATPPAPGPAPVVEEEEAPTNTTEISEPEW